jgi:hypothetical protein
MPVHDLNESHLSELQVEGLTNAFIIENPALEKILFDRNLIGLNFTDACEDSSEYFLRHFEPEIKDVIEDIAEFVLLSKSIYYWMHNAFAKVFNDNLQSNLAATSRVKVESSSAKIAIPYCNFDAPSKNLIIADTIASGATICQALSTYLNCHELDNVFIFSIAGSLIGGKAISKFCHSRNINLTLAYGLAAFGLGSNGFDPSFLHPETITNVKYKKRAAEVFHNKPVSSVGWDFGTQAQAIRKYKMLCWLEAEYWGLQDSEVFRYKEPRLDMRLIEKEYIAYKSKSITM